ncbi:hypothetical protein IJT93_00725 [bacterium]|nr:hypothetical protein [bacterium]
MKSYKISLTVIICIVGFLLLTQNLQACRPADYADSFPKMLLLILGIALETHPIRFVPFGRFSCAWACWLALALAVPGNIPLLWAVIFLCMLTERLRLYFSAKRSVHTAAASAENAVKSVFTAPYLTETPEKQRQECRPAETALLLSACSLLTLTVSLWILAQSGCSPETAADAGLNALRGDVRFTDAELLPPAVIGLYPLLNTVLPFIFIPGLKAAAEPEAAMRRQRLSVCELSLGILGLAAYKSLNGDFCLFVLITVAVISCRAWGFAVFQSEDWLRSRRLSRSLENKDKKLLAVQKDCSDLSIQLRSDRQERQLVNIIEQELTLRNNGETLKTALELTAKMVNIEQAAIFGSRSGRLVPRFYIKEDELLKNWDLLDLQDPLLNMACCRRTAVTLQELAESDLQLPPGPFAYPFQIAVFMAEGSVLWLARSHKEFNDREIRLLKEAALKIGLADRESQHAEDLQKQLQELAQANAYLSAWNERINEFMAGLNRALDLSGSRAALNEIESLVKTIIEADCVCFVFGGENDGEKEQSDCEREAAPPPQPVSAESRRSLEELRRCVCRNRRPLLIDDLRGSRFKPPHPEIISILAVPVMSRYLSEECDSDEPDKCRAVSDAVILGACRTDAFSRQDQDIMQLLAERLDVILRSRRLQMQLQRANQDLKKSQASLIQSGKMAAIGQMAAGLAHELNTPLGSVILGIDSAALSLKREKTQTAAERLDTAKKAAQHAQSIIKNLLYYSREEAQKDLRPINLNLIIDDAIALIGHRLKKCGLTVRKTLGELPLCTVNRSEMQQVFTNLILNSCDAVKDSPEPHILEISSHIDSKGLVELCFKDNGCGIAPDHLKRIFEPFFTTKEPGCGTGLGLSVSREILSKLNGELLAESCPGSTVFTVKLPCG